MRCAMNDFVSDITYEKPWSWMYFRVPEPSTNLVKQFDLRGNAGSEE